VRGVVLGFAHLSGLLGSVHFCVLPHPRLAEHGEQHDPALGGEPVGQTDGVAVVAKTEAQFA
jgi:hypothetical protein